MLVLYQVTEGGPVRSAELRLGYDGNVSINILVSSPTTDRLARGELSLESPRRKILPHEGQLFLDTVAKRTRHATYWYAEEEPDVS